MTKLMEDLTMSAESGRLISLDITDTLIPDDVHKKKQAFLDSLCTLIRKARLLKLLNISKI